MKRSWWVVTLAVAVASPAAAQVAPVERLDPMLRLLVRPELTAEFERVAPLWETLPVAERPLAGQVEIQRTASGEAGIGVLALVRNEAAIAALRQAGAEIGSRIGDIVTAVVPLRSLHLLQAITDLQYAEAAQTLKLVHDSSRLVTRIDTLRTRADHDFRGSTGEGVLIGIYDTGIDYGHDDFRTPDGRHRVQMIWDQLLAGTPPPGLYGHVCTHESIVNGTCASQDTFGHGTHVAGSAAGDGSAGGSAAFLYTGMAPGADLLVVHGGTSFPENRIVDGLDWLSEQARALARPMVVNVSIGGQFGAHDGTRLHEQAINGLSRDSFVVVVAAGNEGNNPNTIESFTHFLIHGMAQPAAGDSALFELVVPSESNPGSCNDFSVFNIWYGGPDSIGIRVVRPDGSFHRAETGDTATSNVSSNGRILLDMPAGVHALNGDRSAYVELSDCAGGGVPQAGTWRLYVVPLQSLSKTVHLWMYASLHGNSAARGTTGFDNSHVVGSPATADSAVTVAAYVSRRVWTSIDGNDYWLTESRTEAQYGDIALFSSGGPTRDGRLKPDVTAPGKFIISARSRQASFPTPLIVEGGSHVVLQGSSMAAPHVTGVVALMMQHDPGLSPGQVKAIFQQTARRDALTDISYTGTGNGWPNHQWGYGKLDARAALEDMVNLAATVASIRLPLRVDTIPPGTQRTYTPTLFNGYGGDFGPATVTWTSSSPAIASVDAGGTVTANALGRAIIYAQRDAGRDSIIVDVFETTLAAAVIVAPSPATVWRTGTLQLAVTVLDEQENVLTDRPVTWSSSDPGIATVSQTGLVQGIALGEAFIRANVDGVEDSTLVTVREPAHLTLEATPLAPQPTAGPDTVPMLRLPLQIDGEEAMRIDTIAFRVTALDPDARLVILHAGTGEVLASRLAPANAQDTARMTTGFVVGPGPDSVLVALALSGAQLHGSLLRVEFLPALTRTTGAESGLRNRHTLPGMTISSGSMATVLAEGEFFVLSENPVRSEQVIFNFASRPSVAAIYTLNGRRVRNLVPDNAGDLQTTWDLRNEEGNRVAPGVYLLVVRVDGQLHRQRLFVARPQQEEE